MLQLLTLKTQNVEYSKLRIVLILKKLFKLKRGGGGINFLYQSKKKLKNFFF